jgi:hypothetical protein
VWKGACPDSVGFLRFDSVGETLGQQRALFAQSFGGSNCIFPGVWVGEVFGEENVGDFLTWHTTDFHNGCTEVAVALSPVAHTVKVSGGFND